MTAEGDCSPRSATSEAIARTATHARAALDVSAAVETRRGDSHATVSGLDPGSIGIPPIRRSAFEMVIPNRSVSYPFCTGPIGADGWPAQIGSETRCAVAWEWDDRTVRKGGAQRKWVLRPTAWSPEGRYYRSVRLAGARRRPDVGGTRSGQKGRIIHGHQQFRPRPRLGAEISGVDRSTMRRSADRAGLQ
jgi:hypothetical protein